ncbi:hypothetical protein PINS_up009353 [Pythium insidiosum]|nr:hypothetical protein PINS_up009353 [Pythium insidiosum]
MCFSDDEWKDKCKAMRELKGLLAEFVRRQQPSEAADADIEATAKDRIEALFSMENVQMMIIPFRTILLDLRSAVVKEACETFATFVGTLGPAKCKILVRDVFPTLLDARGSGNKINASSINECIENIIKTTPSRHIMAPILTALTSSKNREIRESCIGYILLAMKSWDRSHLDGFKSELQKTITGGLTDASQKSRDVSRECYWIFGRMWPEDAEALEKTLDQGVKKHLKRPRSKDDPPETPVQGTKRRHLATITNTIERRTGDAVASGVKTDMKSGIPAPRSGRLPKCVPGDSDVSLRTPVSNVKSTPAASARRLSVMHKLIGSSKSHPGNSNFNDSKAAAIRVVQEQPCHSHTTTTFDQTAFNDCWKSLKSHD